MSDRGSAGSGRGLPLDPRVVPALLRAVAILLLTGVLGAGLLCWRAVTEGHAEMRASDAAFDRGELPAAMLHARRAAVLYVPGAPHVREAYERLEAIAVGAEGRGDRDTARAAWRATRGAALETRHVWLPEAERLERANRNLGRLSVSGPTSDDARARVQREAALTALRKDAAPRPIWVLVLCLGLTCVAVGLGLAGRRGLTPSGELVRRPALAGALTAALGVVAWAVAVLGA